MGNFNRGGGSFRGGRGGRPDFGGRRGGFGGDRFEKKMHKATCSECGNVCEVPFRPTGDKPVYCNDCFSKRGGKENRMDSDRGSFRERRNDRPRFDNSPAVSNDSSTNKKIDELSSKIDKLNEIIKTFISKSEKSKEPEITLKDAVNASLSKNEDESKTAKKSVKKSKSKKK